MRLFFCLATKCVSGLEAWNGIYYFYPNYILVVIRCTHISCSIVFLKKAELCYLNIHYHFHEPTAGSSPHPDDFSRQSDNVSVENYYLYYPPYLILVSRHNVVSTATCSEMDGPGLGSHGGEIFWTYLVRPQGPQPPVR